MTNRYKAAARALLAHTAQQRRGERRAAGQEQRWPLVLNDLGAGPAILNLSVMGELRRHCLGVHDLLLHPVGAFFQLIGISDKASLVAL